MGGMADRAEEERQRRSEQKQQLLPAADDGSRADGKKQWLVENWCTESAWRSANNARLFTQNRRIRRKLVGARCANNKK